MQALAAAAATILWRDELFPLKPVKCQLRAKSLCKKFIQFGLVSATLSLDFTCLTSTSFTHCAATFCYSFAPPLLAVARLAPTPSHLPLAGVVSMNLFSIHNLIFRKQLTNLPVDLMILCLLIFFLPFYPRLNSGRHKWNVFTQLWP